MKLIKAALVTATLTLLSTSVFASQFGYSAGNVVERLGARTIKTDAVQTKQEAYQLGLSQLHQLNKAKPVELSKKLKISGVNIDRRQIHLNEGGYVTVEEFMNTDGQISYKGEINVSFHYPERDSNN